MRRVLLYLLGFAGCLGAALMIWQHKQHPPRPPEIAGGVVAAPVASSTVTTMAVPAEEEVNNIWRRELRRPLYDPPPPEPKPPPPPPQMMPIDVVGMMEEGGNSFVLLQIGPIGQQLMGVGEKVSASGTEVEVMSISPTNVQLRVGSREVTLDRK